MSKKDVAIGIPAFHAIETIKDTLASIQIQSYKNRCQVIIANDDPADNGKYDFLKTLYPDLEIITVNCDKNAGPGIARQRALDACTAEWITFIDADDIFISPFSIESLLDNTTPNCIEVQGPFFQEIEQGKMSAAEKQQLIQMGQGVPPRMMPRNDVTHPWVFGRLYRVSFLREAGIKFSELRAMEDGQFNWEIRMSIEGSPLMINRIEDPIYLWRTGSEHSITRIGMEENGGIPLYNWDLCLVGSTAAAINAIKFCKKKNPFNGGITRFTVEQMVSHYFSYIKCLNEKPIFAEQNLFNAKRFYHSCYKEIENQIDEEILKTMYTAQYAGMAQDMINIIPEITFFEFMNKIKTEPYGGKEEFDTLRGKLPKWVIDLDKKSGVLGDEGYVYTVDEKNEK